MSKSFFCRCMHLVMMQVAYLILLTYLINCGQGSDHPRVFLRIFYIISASLSLSLSPRFSPALKSKAQLFILFLFVVFEMTSNYNGSPQYKHEFPGLSLPSDSAVVMVNKQENPDPCRATIFYPQVFETPIIFAEVDSGLEDDVSNPVPTSATLPGDGAITQLFETPSLVLIAEVDSGLADHVSNPVPISAILLGDAAITQNPSVDEMKSAKRRRTLRKSIVISIRSIAFEAIKLCKDPIQLTLGMRETLPPATTDEGAEVDIGNSTSPDLFNNWTKETRKRSDGKEDNVYYHPSSPRIFRSVAEVTRFIEQKLSFVETRHVGNQTSEALHMETANKELVEKFLADAEENLLNYFKNEDLVASFNNSDTTSPESINEMIEELLDDLQAPPLEEQDRDHPNGVQGMTAFEIEMAKIASAELPVAEP